MWIENCPAYWAFWELAPERNTGFDEGYIPRREIRQYALDEGLDFDELFWKIRALDKAYLEERKRQDEEKRALEAAQREQAARVTKRRRR